MGNLNHYDYIYKINDWAEIRGLNRSDFLAMQLEKSREEDAIGDIYVTLVVAFKLLKPIETVYYVFRSTVLWHSKDELETSWICFSELLRTTDARFYKTFISEEKIDVELFKVLVTYINLLDVVAKKYDLELVECVDYAYNQIKNRTGKMIDGSFVKDK